MNGRVVTVLGAIEPSEMGVTDAHNHLWIAPVKDGSEGLPVLHEAASIAQELKEYRQTGGGSQIDCQPGGAGRDGNRLRQFSQECGVHVVACTGFHLREYYPDQAEVWRFDEAGALQYFLSEITEGLVETREEGSPVFPGFIKIAVRESVASSPMHLVEAAAAASSQSGCAIAMHTEKGQAVERFIERFQDFGLDLSRLVVCHIDKRPDLVLHKQLAQAGCLLEYDTFFRPKYSPEQNLWQLIVEMVEAGLHQSIALATDLADPRLWRTMGDGPGLIGFSQGIRQRLGSIFSNEEVVKSLMGDNIAHRLALKS